MKAVDCLACNRLNLGASALARSGFGRCEADSCRAYCDVTSLRDCSTFSRAPAAQVAERRAWLAKQHPTIAAEVETQANTENP